MIDQKWYARFFGEDYFRIYGPFLTPDRTDREVNQIAELLSLPPESEILDLCCGHGRHAIPLAERGYRVTGQDLSAFFLEKAEADAADAGVQLNLVQRDMRDIPFEDKFDAVINIFSAFGYLESDEEDQKVLHQVHKALKPGSRFLLDTVHHAWLTKNFEPREWHVGTGETIVLEERQWDLLSGHNETTVILIQPDGSREQHQYTMRIYTAAELVRIVTATGLQIDATYGALDGRELTLDAPRVVVLASK